MQKGAVRLVRRRSAYYGDMSYLQPRPNNPIELRKAAVRKYTRNAAIWAGGGIAAGLVLGLLATELWLFIILAGIGLIGGFVNWQKVQKIVNYKDPQ